MQIYYTLINRRILLKCAGYATVFFIIMAVVAEAFSKAVYYKYQMPKKYNDG